MLPPCALLLCLPALGADLFESRLVAGDYWGLPIQEAALRLGAGAARIETRPTSEWFLEPALKKAGEPSTGELARVELSSGAWLLARDGKLFGYVAKASAEEQEFYGDLARKHFDRSKIIHLEEPPPKGRPGPVHFLHCVHWEGSKTNLLLLTATPKLGARSWIDPETGTKMRVEVLYKKEDQGVPLYLVFWDSRRRRE